jgi:CRISPR-associated endoribonuclease Cas6
MRLYLQLTKNNKTIPFNYQPYLTGAIHKWVGHENNVHDALSLYSFSWFQNINVKGRNGINLNENSYFFISAHEPTLLKKIIKGIMADPFICFGTSVSDIQIGETPVFSNMESFSVGSPVFIKRRVDNNEKHITYDDPTSNTFLTETLQKKLKAANLPSENVKVKFDLSFLTPQTKVIWYKEIGNRVNICPVIIEGIPEQIAFAWDVGIGNSTGIGFGALK